MNNLREQLIAAKTNKGTIERDLTAINTSLIKEQTTNESLVKARWAITEVTTKTQEFFKDRVNSLTTLALRSVFDSRDFEFKLIFERKRNRPECRPVIIEDGYEYDDISFYKGGGIIPIIGFALRVVVHSLERPRSRDIFILDEPIKGAVGEDGDLLAKTALMLKDISSKLGLQLIIVTHEHSFLEIADRAWQVFYSRGESGVKMIKGEVEKKKLKLIRRRRVK